MMHHFVSEIRAIWNMWSVINLAWERRTKWWTHHFTHSVSISLLSTCHWFSFVICHLRLCRLDELCHFVDWIIFFFHAHFAMHAIQVQTNRLSWISIDDGDGRLLHFFYRFIFNEIINLCAQKIPSLNTRWCDHIDLFRRTHLFLLLLLYSSRCAFENKWTKKSDHK